MLSWNSWPWVNSDRACASILKWCLCALGSSLLMRRTVVSSQANSVRYCTPVPTTASRNASACRIRACVPDNASCTASSCTSHKILLQQTPQGGSCLPESSSAQQSAAMLILCSGAPLYPPLSAAKPLPVESVHVHLTVLPAQRPPANGTACHSHILN